jgi:alpha-L-rhamnosidase
MIIVLCVGCIILIRGDHAAAQQAPRAEGSAEKVVRAQIQPTELKTEYLVEPLGIETPHPRFSWLLDSSARGQMESAYQILVASSMDRLAADRADKWDSGKIVSNESVGVPYQGTVLTSGERCYWKVRVWDARGNASAYSSASLFEMGLLRNNDWEGKWIGAKEGISSPLLRKEFALDRPIARARVYISGLGYYELHINGKKVGDHVLDPGTTYYNNDQPFELGSRVLYVTYDVTAYLKTGLDAVGVVLGNGWYSAEADIPPSPSFRDPYGDRPALILQLNIEFTDGGSASIVTDNRWKSSGGAILYNDYDNGETYDARLEKPGWEMPGYNDSGWDNAVLVQPPGGALTAQMMPPTKVMKTVQPVRILKPKNGVYVYDMGQNFTGWTKLHLSGPRGTKVTLRYGMRIYKDNTLDARSNLYNCPSSKQLYLEGIGRREGWHHCARQTDTYILKGDGNEVWEPRFTLHGFRYVEVAGFPGTPKPDSLEGRVVRSAVETSGTFTCSNRLINQIHHNVCWSFMGSFQSIPQPVSDRSERVAWLGNPGFAAEDIIYNYDTASFWTKWLNDIKDSQQASGDVPFVSPIHWRHPVPSRLGPQGSTFNVYDPLPSWQSTYPLIAWYVYQYYGDERVLKDHYYGLKRLVDFLSTKADGYILSFGLGDYMEPQTESRYSSETPKHTPVSLPETAYYYYDAWILSQVAGIVGKADDAKCYSGLARNIKAAFNKMFFNEATNQYATGSQTSNALPLYLGMVPQEREKAVAKNLVDEIMTKHKGHFSTGVIGLNALEQALREYGWAEVMYKIATQKTWPSWGYMVEHGATTLWEDWEGDGKREFSLDCYLLGEIEKFFYKDLAGVSPAKPGYSRITIKPQVVGDLSTASASLKTVRGTVAVKWQKSDSTFELIASVPGNAEADVSIPKLGLDNIAISEGVRPVWKNHSYVPGVEGVSSGAEGQGWITFQVGSGTYDFKFERTPK